MVKNILFTGGWGGWEEKWGLKLTSAKVEVEVEAELGNTLHDLKRLGQYFDTKIKHINANLCLVLYAVMHILS